MAIASIISLILFVVIAVLVFKFIKNTIKSIFILLAILTLVVVVGGITIYSDVNDFRQNFPTVPSLYLLEKDNQIVAGIYGTFSEEAPPSLVGTEQLASYQNNYQANNLDDIKGDYYKLFVMKAEAFDSITEIKTDGETISKQAVFDLLGSSTPINDFMAQKGLPQEQRSALLTNLNVKNDAEFKSLLFTLLFAKSIQEKGPTFIFIQFKQENIIIYPDTTITLLIKEVPLSLLNSVILKITGE